MGKYEGIREKVKGKRYEIYFRPYKGSNTIFRNIEATGFADAYEKRLDMIAEYRKNISLPHTDRLTADFSEIWGKLHQGLLADRLTKKAVGHYRNTFTRLFVNFLGKHYPHIKNPKQLSLPFFKEYKNYYVNELNRPDGWRAELIFIKSLIRRLYHIGYCSKDLMEDLKQIKRPQANKKDYPNIPISEMHKLFSFIKKDRPDYYFPLYFMFKTGRRRQETTLIKKEDVVRSGFKPIAINIRPETTKTKKKAPITGLDENLEHLIRQTLSNNESDWLFPDQSGNKCSADGIYEYLKKVSQEAIGIAITPHYFRHRFITECAKANAPIADVKAISGIKDNNVLLEHYSHSTEEGQRQVLGIMRL
ncbi:MAG: tyrosine-type recombinase/integrase [Planctomycetota bacterium]|jgi:integrase